MSASLLPANDHVDRILNAAISHDSLELPPPPQIVAQVMRLTRGEATAEDSADASAAQLAQLIQRDLALAGQVMRVANSALYARRTPVVTLPQAIAWLGIREIRNIAFAVAVQGQIFTSGFFRREMTDLWRESVIVALFAQEVARIKRRNVESAYLCGLLHRAGMAVILNRAGVAAAKQGFTPAPAQLLALAARQEARVGTHVGIAWSLPPAVAAAIAHWRNPLDAELARTEVMEVALARQIANEMRTPGAGGELPDYDARPGVALDGRAVDLPRRAVHYHGAARGHRSHGGKLPALKPEVAQARVVVRSPSQWPAELALRLADQHVVDAGMAAAHEPQLVELPVLVAAGQEPVSGVIVPLIGEAHGNSRTFPGPDFLDETVVELLRPFALQEFDDGRPPGEELGAIAPGAVHRVGQRHAFGIARIPRILGRARLHRRRLSSERRKWRTSLPWRQIHNSEDQKFLLNVMPKVRGVLVTVYGCRPHSGVWL